MTMLPSLSASVLAILLALAGPADAAEVFKHSGSIVSIAPDVQSFILAEVGPWQTRDGKTVVTRRTVVITPETEYTMVGRLDEPRDGYPGGFIEVAIEPEQVYLHDYVTVECRHEGDRMVALKITVIEVPSSR
jgi:hypothetical protein